MSNKLSGHLESFIKQPINLKSEWNVRPVNGKRKTNPDTEVDGSGTERSLRKRSDWDEWDENNYLFAIFHIFSK